MSLLTARRRYWPDGLVRVEYAVFAGVATEQWAAWSMCGAMAWLMFGPWLRVAWAVARMILGT